MKKSLHTLLMLLLAANVLFVGMGWDCVRCNCTGAVKLVPCGVVEDDDNCCEPDEEGCLTLVHLELSPTEAAHDLSFDTAHTILSPWVALPAFAACWSAPEARTTRPKSTHTARKAPPRDYLTLIRVLLI